MKKPKVLKEEIRVTAMRDRKLFKDIGDAIDDITPGGLLTMLSKNQSKTLKNYKVVKAITEFFRCNEKDIFI